MKKGDQNKFKYVISHYERGDSEEKSDLALVAMSMGVYQRVSFPRLLELIHNLESRLNNPELTPLNLTGKVEGFKEYLLVDDGDVSSFSSPYELSEKTRDLLKELGYVVRKS